MHTLWQTLLDLVYPPRCILCGRIPRLKTLKEQKRFEQLGLCPDCSLQPYRLSVRQSVSHSVPWGRSCFRYEGRLSKALSALKYEGMKNYGACFARWMLLCPDIPEYIRGAELLTSVPVSAERMKKRGYNQAELIARELSRSTGVPYLDLLVRDKKTAAQKNLGRTARRENLSGAFRIADSLACRAVFSGEKPWKVLLADDILTTGATVEECRRVLENGNPQVTVRFLTFSRDELS